MRPPPSDQVDLILLFNIQARRLQVGAMSVRPIETYNTGFWFSQQNAQRNFSCQFVDADFRHDWAPLARRKALRAMKPLLLVSPGWAREGGGTVPPQ